MSIPEVSSLARALALSDAEDSSQQRSLLVRMLKLRNLLARLDLDAFEKLSSCLDVSATLTSHIANRKPLSPDDILSLVTRLMACLEDGLLVASRCVGSDSSSSSEENASAAGSALGEILVQLEAITPGQLDEALVKQEARGTRIGEILEELGYTTRARIEEALEIQIELRSRWVESRGEGTASEADPGSDATLLGEILIRTGVVTRRQLERALEIRESSRTQVGEALVQLGAATWPQIRGAIRIQEKLRRSVQEAA